MPAKHAVLSASSSKQWIHCPPSARLQEGFPNEPSVYAEEGTWAHELCEYKVKKYLHERKKRPQSEFLTEEIDQITDVYADFIISIIEGMRGNGCEPLCFVEERLDFSNIVPDGFGTGDMVIIGKDEDGRGLIHITDFKAGRGVFVDAHKNSQMMLYGLPGSSGGWMRSGMERTSTVLRHHRSVTHRLHAAEHCFPAVGRSGLQTLGSIRGRASRKGAARSLS